MMCFLSFMSFAACGVQVQYCDVFRRGFLAFPVVLFLGLGLFYLRWVIFYCTMWVPWLSYIFVFFFCCCVLFVYNGFLCHFSFFWWGSYDEHLCPLSAQCRKVGHFSVSFAPKLLLFCKAYKYEHLRSLFAIWKCANADPYGCEFLFGIVFWFGFVWVKFVWCIV